MCVICDAHKNTEKWSYKEDLFRALIADDVGTVRKIIRFHCPKDMDLNDHVFGIYCERLSTGLKFIAYGVFLQDNKVPRAKTKWIKNGASLLHVASWSNALRSAKFLLSSGCQTSGFDGCGKTAFERAKNYEMRELMKRPTAPLNLSVLSSSEGYVILTWSSMKTRPAITIFEIRESNFDNSWILDALHDVDSFTVDERKESALVYEFTSPPGAIHSGQVHQFSIRCQDANGYWSEWTNADKPFHSKHYAALWAADCVSDDASSDSEDERKREEKTRDLPDTRILHRELIIGSKSFGYVHVDDYISRVRKEQYRACVLIQSIIRQALQRRRYLRMLQEIYERNRRDAAAREIQGSYRRHTKRLAMQREMLLAMDASKKASMSREIERYKIMQSLGFDFTGNLQAAWR